MMTNKLAVLVSGSYRNFDQVWNSNLPVIEKLGVPFQVFFHTWQDNPNLNGNVLKIEFKNRFYFSFFPKCYQSFNNEISESSIYEKYHFSRIIVDEFPESLLSEKYNLGSPKHNIRYGQLLNSTAMYFGIDKCRIELMRSEPFTHFLRLRTDFLLDPLHTKEIFQGDLTFFGQLLPTPEGPIGDQCFGGKLDKTFPILDLMETVFDITHSSSWDTTKSMVLAEDVIRRRLEPFRNEWNIQFFEGFGMIKRPDLVTLNFDIRVLREICIHNGVRLCSIFIALLSKLKQFLFAKKFTR